MEEDPEFRAKLTLLLGSAFAQAGEPAAEVKQLEEVASKLHGQGVWKLPNSHHVTSLFVGGNKAKLSQFFEEGKAVAVDVRAVIYVPKKLIAGVCFPLLHTENQFPHLTLLISEGWNAVLSNALLTATCAEGAPFHEAYLAASKGQLPSAEAGVLSAEVVVPKKGKQEAVFVLLRKPVCFSGVTKSFF